MYKMPSYMQKLTDDLFTDYLNNSTTWNEMGMKCGYTLGKGYSVVPVFALQGRAKRQIQNRIEKLHLSDKHLCHVRTYNQKPLEQLKGKRRCCKFIRKKLQNAGVPYVCQSCKCKMIGYTFVNGEWHWRGQQIKLEIDHINGVDGTDKQDEIDNLRFLCANCHSQTPNHRKKRKIDTKFTTRV